MVGGIGIKIHYTKFQTNRRQKISLVPSQLFVIVINLELYIPLFVIITLANLIEEPDIWVRLLAVDTKEAQAGEPIMDVDKDNIVIQEEGRWESDDSLEIKKVMMDSQATNSI